MYKFKNTLCIFNKRFNSFFHKNNELLKILKYPELIRTQEIIKNLLNTDKYRESLNFFLIKINLRSNFFYLKMLSSNLLFFIFSLLLVFSASMVVISQQPVFSLLFLVSSFILSSFLLFLLECEFLALLFIIIYVGAIAILFLFAIMMLETKLVDLKRNTIQYFPAGIIFFLLLIIPLFSLINKHFGADLINSNNFYLNIYQNWYDLIDSTNDINVYGQVLYSYFVLQFLIAGLILLLILIGVVYLTNTFEKHTIQQSSFRQLSRNAKIF